MKLQSKHSLTRIVYLLQSLKHQPWFDPNVTNLEKITTLQKIIIEIGYLSSSYGKMTNHKTSTKITYCKKYLKNTLQWNENSCLK